MVKYSFVLPAYKAHFFKEALDSILTQTYKDFELVIVNDASPEDLDSIVEQYEDSRIRYYVNEKNIGGKDLVAQWNHCLEYAQGDYIILASDDDVYHPEYLEKMDKLVCKYPDVNVFRPRIQIINQIGEILELESYLNEYSSNLEFSYAWKRGYIKSGIPFYIFNKTALINMGGFINFPLAWYSDDATVLNIAKDGIATCNDVLFSFRYSNKSITTKKNDRRTLKFKLDATDLFYCWYRKHIENIEPKNKYEYFYKKNIINNIEQYKRNESLTWLVSSTFTAILYHSIRLIKTKTTTLKTLLYYLRNSI